MIKSVTWARAQAFAQHRVNWERTPRVYLGPAPHAADILEDESGRFWVDNGSEFLVLPKAVATEALDGRITFAQWAKLRGMLESTHPESILVGGDYHATYLLEWEEGGIWWNPDDLSWGEPYAFFLEDAAQAAGFTAEVSWPLTHILAPLYIAGATPATAAEAIKRCVEVV